MSEATPDTRRTVTEIWTDCVGEVPLAVRLKRRNRDVVVARARGEPTIRSPKGSVLQIMLVGVFFVGWCAAMVAGWNGLAILLFLIDVALVAFFLSRAEVERDLPGLTRQVVIVETARTVEIVKGESSAPQKFDSHSLSQCYLRSVPISTAGGFRGAALALWIAPPVAYADGPVFVFAVFENHARTRDYAALLPAVLAEMYRVDDSILLRAGHMRPGIRGQIGERALLDSVRLCPRCRYDLTGLGCRGCSECGHGRGPALVGAPASLP